jgi:hypothetical protein
MATPTTTAPTFRYVGTTDECVECQKCGKADLRATVVLAILDVDGNEEEITYYGSTCAARALTARGMRVKGGGREILQSARWATQKLRTEAADARRMLRHYGLPETGEPAESQWVQAELTYEYVHRHAMWAHEVGRDGGPTWRGYAAEMLDRKRATLREAALVGL